MFDCILVCDGYLPSILDLTVFTELITFLSVTDLCAIAVLCYLVLAATSKVKKFVIFSHLAVYIFVLTFATFSFPADLKCGVCFYITN